MPPARPTPEQYADLPFPVAGVDQTAPYHQQRPQTTRVGENVRAYEPLAGRQRGGARPGLSKYIAQQLPTAARVQCLASVVTSSANALPWIFDYPFLNLVDPSSPGLPGDWPPGRFSRVPPLLIPTGGWLVPPAKSLPRPVKIVWSRPADITLGTALGGTQLNATAQDATNGTTISGSFSYSPASGVDLPLGQQQALSATFTAADPSNYQTGIKAANLINVVSAPPTGIAFVQAEGTRDVGVASVPVAFDADVTSGHLLAVFGAQSASVTTPPVLSVSDSRGNTWHQVASQSYSNVSPAVGGPLVLWYAIANSSGPCTVTVGTDTTAGFLGLAVLEYSGVDTLSPLDGHSANADGSDPATATALTSGTVAVSGAGRLLLGAMLIDNPSLAVFGPDFTGRAGGPLNTSVVDFIGAGSAEAVTATNGSATRYVAIGASFKPQ